MEEERPQHRFGTTAAATVGEAVEAAKDYLASDRGRRARAMLAAGMIAAAPLVMRIPAVRAHPVGRLLAFVGGAAAVVKTAELIRDWEPSPGTSEQPAE